MDMSKLANVRFELPSELESVKKEIHSLPNGVKIYEHMFAGLKNVAETYGYYRPRNSDGGCIIINAPELEIDSLEELESSNLLSFDEEITDDYEDFEVIGNWKAYFIITNNEYSIVVYNYEDEEEIE
jgi:hypothetical protein